MSHQLANLLSMTRRITGRLRGSASAFAAAGLAVAVVTTASVAGVWVFRRSSAQTTDDSVWRLLLTDRATVGFVRAAVIMLALYAIASTAALAMSGGGLKPSRPAGLKRTMHARPSRRSAVSRINFVRQNRNSARRNDCCGEFCMVKSNVQPMPKRRKIQVDPELLKELEELERRSQENARKSAEVLARSEEVRRRLRQMYARS
jgi:hypothetical protein